MELVGWAVALFAGLLDGAESLLKSQITTNILLILILFNIEQLFKMGPILLDTQRNTEDCAESLRRMRPNRHYD